MKAEWKRAEEAAVARPPDDSLELILRGGFGKGLPPLPPPVRGVSGASGP